MIKRFEISGIHYEITPELNRYVKKKIGRLDSYMSLHIRKSAHIEVKLKESKSKDKKQCTCEVVMHLPNETVAMHESTMNMFAAVDIVEAKLKNKLKKYKDKHHPSRRRRVVRRVLGRIHKRYR